MAKKKSRGWTPPVAECKLCLEVLPLKRSHVIPEFMYEPIYDEGTSRGVSVAADGSGRVLPVQIGHREPLLCDACEHRLSPWEDHAARVWRQIRSRVKGRHGGEIIVERGRYFELKLFTLSLFWRMSLSQYPNFRAIALGQHESTIREMLFTDTPGSLAVYPSFIFAYQDLDLMVGTIGLGGGGAWEGIPAYRIQISGLEWFFFASQNVPDAPLNPRLAVSHRGLTVMVSNVPESRELNRIAGHVYPNGAA